MSVFTLTKQTRLPLQNLTGQQFERWTVLRFAGRDLRGNLLWECRCSCGNTGTVKGRYLHDKTSRSCGCLRREAKRQAAERETEVELRLLPGAYRNGTPAYDASKVVDQPSTRKKLKELAEKLRPGEDPISAPLHPNTLRFDCLARACAILAIRYPSEDNLYDCRFALERAKLPLLATQVFDVARGAKEAGTLNDVRRLLAEALSK